MKDFSRSMRTTTVLHEPRGVSIAFQGILHRYKFIQNVQIESCSNSLVLKKGPLHPLEKRCPKPGIWGGGMQGWWYRNISIFHAPNAKVLLIEEAVPSKIRFINEPNVSHMDFASMQLLQHSVRDRLAYINICNTNRLAGLNPVCKQVETVAHEMVCGYVS